MLWIEPLFPEGPVLEFLWSLVTRGGLLAHRNDVKEKESTHKDGEKMHMSQSAARFGSTMYVHFHNWLSTCANFVRAISIVPKFLIFNPNRNECKRGPFKLKFEISECLLK